MPTVSVLMPVYNASPFVGEAIKSILGQSFTDFELLVFNDGSTDNSRDVINCIEDKRIVFIDSIENRGYVHHLNIGLQMAKGVYIARMDADDIALPTRFEKQVALLEAHSEVGLCGTMYQTFGAISIIPKIPNTNEEIQQFMLYECPLGHPTVMFRKALVEKYNLRYDPSFMPAEDYKLWFDFSKITKIQNLSEVLLYYRVHHQQISSYMNEVQQKNASRVRLIQLLEKGFNLSVDEQSLYIQLFCFVGRPQTADELMAVIQLMNKVSEENKLLRAYKKECIANIFENAWPRIIGGVYQFSLAHLRPIFLSDKPFASSIGVVSNIKILLKCLIGWQSRTH